MFRNLSDHPNDPIEAMFVRLANDTHADRIDLGIGVFRDDSGTVPVMQAVRQAEARLFERDLSKTYLSPLGNLDYCRSVEALVLGDDHPARAGGRIVSAQTPGAGPALRAAAELVHDLAPGSAVWVSTPVWGHQIEFFEQAGMAVRSYRYYDSDSGNLDAAGMLEDLRSMRAGDLLLLHGCCHNPTGEDLTLDLWESVAEIVVETGAIPFVDVAYQGFGRGIEYDVAGLRLLASRVPELLLTVSSSKSFGIYRDRAGLLSIVLPPEARNAGAVRRKLRDTLRQLYFMAPDHGAAIVHEILSTPELEALWRSELDAVRGRIVELRAALRRTIERANPGFDAGFIERQQGMFSCLPISAEEQLLMESRFHIYMLPPARVNVAAMNREQSEVLADAFAWVRAQREVSIRHGSRAGPSRNRRANV